MYDEQDKGKAMECMTNLFLINRVFQTEKNR